MVKNGTTNQVTLKVAETNPKLVGRGMALVDPKVVEELGLSTGDIIELAGKKKSYVLLWSSQPDDYGKRLIRIDGYTRNNIGVGIDDHVAVQKVSLKKAEQVILAPTEELNIVGLEEYLPELLEGRVVTKGDIIPLNIMGRRIGFAITGTSPSDAASLIDAHTEFVIGAVPKATKGVPRISYEDIGGLRPVIQKVREMIELPLRHPEIFERVGIEAPKGVLLYGPPGTGKTLLAKAVASETNANFYSIGGPEIMSKFYGESEERLREIFKEAQENAPSIIFIDEIDSIAPKREEVTGEVEKRVVSQLLSVMDGLQSRGKVVVIGASVTGDTPIMVRDRENKIKLTPIGPFVDSFFPDGEEGSETNVKGYHVLGLRPTRSRNPRFRKYTFFGGSRFQSFKAVFRHKVNEIFEIEYLGGKIRATGNHSVFVRTRHGIEAKRVDQLKIGENLVDLPFKLRLKQNIQEIRAHTFEPYEPVYFQLYDDKTIQAYNQATLLQDTPGPRGLSHLIALQAGVHPSTVQLWRHNDVVPNPVRWALAGIPRIVALSLELSRLFGYYLAEGSASKSGLTFTFGSHERTYIEDVKLLMLKAFNMSPSTERKHSNVHSIYYSCQPVKDLFGNLFGHNAY